MSLACSRPILHSLLTHLLFVVHVAHVLCGKSAPVAGGAQRHPDRIKKLLGIVEGQSSEHKRPFKATDTE